MLLRNILLESDFNVHLYGAWVNSTTKEVIPIADMMGHAYWVQKNLKRLTKDGYTIDNFNASPYLLAFYNGYVRVMHKDTMYGSEIAIHGQPQDIKNISDMVFELMDEMQPEDDKGFIEIIVTTDLQPTPPGQPPHVNEYKKSFSFPKEDKKIRFFLMSL